MQSDCSSFQMSKTTEKMSEKLQKPKFFAFGILGTGAA
jgi:hypothetical protein